MEGLTLLRTGGESAGRGAEGQAPVIWRRRRWGGKLWQPAGHWVLSFATRTCTASWSGGDST